MRLGKVLLSLHHLTIHSNMSPPQPHATADLITPQQLQELFMDDTKLAGRDYLVVDVRRTDIDVRPPH